MYMWDNSILEYIDEANADGWTKHICIQEASKVHIPEYSYDVYGTCIYNGTIYVFSFSSDLCVTDRDRFDFYFRGMIGLLSWRLEDISDIRIYHLRSGRYVPLYNYFKIVRSLS